MKVGEIMTKDVLMIDKNKKVSDLLDEITEKNVGSFLIELGNDYGIVTRKDIVNKVIAYGEDMDKVKVEDIMSGPVLTISPDLSIVETARLMAKTGVRRFPVMENGKLVGIVSNSDILRTMKSKIED